MIILLIFVVNPLMMPIFINSIYLTYYYIITKRITCVVCDMMESCMMPWLILNQTLKTLQKVVTCVHMGALFFMLG